MHPRQASLLTAATDLEAKLAAKDKAPKGPAPTTFWEYTDEEDNKFYLPKKLTTVRSPYTGKSMTGQKPTVVKPGQFAAELKELKEKAKKAAWSVEASEDMVTAAAAPTTFWEYTDEDENKFYLPKKLTTVRSPYTGKSMTGQKPTSVKPGQFAAELKDLKDKAKDKTAELELPDNRFDMMLENIAKNVEAMQKQVARLGGYGAAMQQGHGSTLKQQLTEIESVCRTLGRRMG